MIEPLTDEDGLEIAGVCHKCESEFEDGDVIIELAEREVVGKGLTWSEVATSEINPVVHKGCLFE